MKLNVIDEKSKVIEELNVNLAEKLDNLGNLLYLVRNYQNYLKMAKTASCKNRSAVRGGGAKPYKQKGTGRARRGTNRTPLRVGGGVIFGPQPIKRKMKINAKVVNFAIKGMLSSRIEDISILKTETISVKDVKKLINKETKKVLLICDLSNDILIRAFRNYSKSIINSSSRIMIDDLLSAEKIFIDYKVKDILDKG